jgi:hypothetical protein
MANPTTYFGWVMPNSADLVTDLPADFNVFGQGVDTSMSQLLGGTTGQVLSKTSGTNMAFTWVTPTDQTPLTTKGDLFTFTTVDARLAVGNNGESIYADSAATSGLRYQGSQAAGKNYLINGAMENWQRGTTSTSTSVYLADRWFQSIEGATTATISQSTSVVPANYRYAMKMQRTAANTGTGGIGIGQSLETTASIPLQSQTVVMSFWLKAGANFSAASGTVNTRIFTGTGTDQSQATAYGSWTGYAETSGTATATTSWTRYSVTATIPSNATQAGVRIFWTPVGTAGADDSLYITGIQMEIGSVATTFTRAGGTLQGELAACQRYYERVSGSSTLGAGRYFSTTAADVAFPYKVTKRTTPTFGSAAAANFNSGSVGVLNSITTNGIYVDSMTIRIGHVATTTTGYACILTGDTNAYIEVIAEL